MLNRNAVVVIGVDDTESVATEPQQRPSAQPEGQIQSVYQRLGKLSGSIPAHQKKTLLNVVWFVGYSKENGARNE